MRPFRARKLLQSVSQPQEFRMRYPIWATYLISAKKRNKVCRSGALAPCRHSQRASAIASASNNPTPQPPAPSRHGALNADEVLLRPQPISSFPRDHERFPAGILREHNCAANLHRHPQFTGQLWRGATTYSSRIFVRPLRVRDIGGLTHYRCARPLSGDAHQSCLRNSPPYLHCGQLADQSRPRKLGNHLSAASNARGPRRELR